ncbi:hypothetical protein GUJ93_ZPchr0001g30815 [Zizania palustris]|uniref:Uncharacterized protein n=1 Tax=Zizania palustris TaxID=103762 RepID=A0A8J5VT14_ZIZPA|nr:hypothetical protein GUJ93_ZPchr0001g30815 [Zizania palustris]
MAANGAKEEAPLQLKQGSKLSKLLSRESSVASPSFRVYYGVASAGSVPFLWESQPGTPKNAISNTALPPLTPPPSYYTAGAKEAASQKGSGGGRKYGILRSILFLPKIRLRKARPSSISPTSSCSSSSTTSSSLSFSSSYSLSFRSMQSPSCSSMRSHARAFSLGDDEDDDDMASTACFRVRHESFRALKTCRVAMTVRSAMASSASGHGPSAAAQRT